ncbi:DUF1446 domain-containing protein [Pseudomonas putida]|uniref:DUF1446 domain-containing protein n=1 Tax=Pseudomonas putida TaxID=303 RepID=A0A4D6XEU2_PSEPU|nr:acyclic terpene utilization AtuA family protein [Pseudomonas putida]QCI13108.1 DUF1446 domain-containing protein [Pseudomonas putida]
MSKRTLRIGAGCSADTTIAWPQMANFGELDYFIADYLYEASVANFAAELQYETGTGFAAEVAGPELEPCFRRFIEKGIKIITNAGGLNPLGCAEALHAVTRRLGLEPKIAVVHGDAVLELLADGAHDMFTGEPLPEDLISANAYFGAKPIAEALALGADIVITGRVVDSAMIVAPLMHEFGWAWDDYDRLGAATAIGHLLECGPQPSGGICTDWKDIDWSNTSFPIAECFDDGTAILTTVPGTGGRIDVGTTAEQILYEINDPQRYYMPEVTCDLSELTLVQQASNRVLVSGARGYAPTSTYKVCCMQAQGWRSVITGVISGPEAEEKARRTVDAVLVRMRRLATTAGFGEFLNTHFELIGSGASQGVHALRHEAREIVYRVVVDHAERAAVEPLARVGRSSSVSMAPGTGALFSSSVAPLMRMYSTLVEKQRIPVLLAFEGETRRVEVPTHGGFDSVSVKPHAPMPVATAGAGTSVALVQLAWLRSGDKGSLSNIGVIARRPEYLPWIKAALDCEAIRDWYAHLYENPLSARIECHELPGLHALNFLMYGALGGGAVSSPRFDPMGKGLAQQLIEFPVPVPEALLR